MLVEHIVRIEETVILSILIIDLDLAAVLHQILHHFFAERLQLDIEI